MHLASFELLLPVKQAARGRASKQTATPVDQQGSPFRLLQGSGQLVSPFGRVKKTVHAATRRAGAASPQSGRLIGLVNL